MRDRPIDRLSKALIIKSSIMKHFKEKGWACIPEFQIGELAYQLDCNKTDLPTKSTYTNYKQAYNMRPDIWLVNKYSRIDIIEVKSCRQDFVTDNKYEVYTRFCDFMYFAIDGDYIDKNELPDNIGLIKLDNSDRGFTFVKKAKRNNFTISLEQRKDLYFRMCRSLSNRYNKEI